MGLRWGGLVQGQGLGAPTVLDLEERGYCVYSGEKADQAGPQGGRRQVSRADFLVWQSNFTRWGS